MKYIITESKLNATIDSFITKQFGKLHHQLDGDKLTLVNDDGEPMIMVIDKDNTYFVWVLDDIWRSGFWMFSMERFTSMQSVLSKWLYNHYNLPVEESNIATFSRGEEEYVY
jgi:tRNA(His) 5'-end guanylyltransferase